MPAVTTNAAALLALSAALSLAVVAYAYVGYPLAARLVPRRRARSAPAEGAPLPFVTVLVAARNEAAVIEARLADLLAQDYPEDRFEVIVVSDASDDGTDALVAAVADPRVRFFRQERRGGKTAAINLAAPAARGSILVQTDANVSFSRGALAALARAFDDPEVGVALGEVSFCNADRPDVAGGEGLYWRFESWCKRVEAARGLLAVANGGIYALRRELWRPLPPAISGDAAEPLLAAAAGRTTVIAAGARAFERAAGSLGEEYARKVRIIAQQVACWRWLGLAPLPGRIRWAYASHKLLRYAAPAFWAFGLAAGLAGAALGSPAAAAVAALAAAPLVCAPLGLLPLPGPLRRAARVPLYLAMVNVAAVAGVLRGLSGRAQAAWETAVSTRVPPPADPVG